MIRFSSCLILCLLGTVLQAQKPASELFHRLQKLKVAGSVLYVAAHPDDENQYFLSYMANERKVRTAYLSLTRGDGGQNLIGSEQNEAVGLIRSHELLKARSVDGAEQFFTRAVDFGYSKSTEETLRKWDEEEVLSDVVYAIRKFQPDIIVTRFPPDERAGHGHHSTSSYLAAKAFDSAADPKAFPEQLSTVSSWQCTRQFWNFYNRGFTNTPPESGPYISLDISKFNPDLGLTYSELAANARSMHRSQGFGAAIFRGKRDEVFEFTKGIPAEKDILEGINLAWNRFEGGELADILIKDILQNYDYQAPYKSIPALLQFKSTLSMLKESSIRNKRLQEIDVLLLDLAGIHLEAYADDYIYTPNEILSGNLEFLHQYPSTVKLKFREESFTTGSNELMRIPFQEKITNIDITQPFHLLKAPQNNFYVHPEGYTTAPFRETKELSIQIELEGIFLDIEVPIKYKYVEPARGELYKDLEIRPSITINPSSEVLIWNNQTAKELRVQVNSNNAKASGKVGIKVPDGWKVTPSFIEAKEFENAEFTFLITPNKNSSDGEFEAFFVDAEGKEFVQKSKEIRYEHIPNLSYFSPSKGKLINLNVKNSGNKVGYVMGAGDEVNLALEQLGFSVIDLNIDNFSSRIKEVETIVIGIRAYNVLDWLPEKSNELTSFMQNGGRVVVQYQTTQGYNKFKDALAPFPFTLSRNRVSEEDAEVRFIHKNHELLTTPNSIEQEDFEGWVQERGLYFADQLDRNYETLLSMNDLGEKPLDTSIIYAKVGKGSYIYTGLSFFRELPAGVKGAYKLMANLVSNSKK